jgi:Protein of unknown function (DUF4446)
VSDLDTLVTEHATLVVAAVALVATGLAIGLAVVARRARRLEERLDALTRGEGGRDLADVLDAHLEKVMSVARRQDELDAHGAALDVQARRAVQGVALVRFNTFEDTGGNQSFALALVDPTGDGVVLTSLHARNQTRLYGRAVRAGAAEGALSAEEAEAVGLASARALGR